MSQDRPQIGIENPLEIRVAVAQHVIEEQYSLLVQRGDSPLEKRTQQDFLRTEMIMDRCRVHPSMARHSSNRGRVEALLREKFFRCIENQDYRTGVGHDFMNISDGQNIQSTD